MKILAHRGFWKSDAEKNSALALNRALDLDLGIETDLRDFMGDVVVSHDIIKKPTFTFEELLQDYCNRRSNATLALNIKSDGQAARVNSLIEKYDIDNYYFFDMSVPDSMDYLRRGLKIYQRISEYESINSLTDRFEGFWLDSLAGKLDVCEAIKVLAPFKKPICIVSEELHGRNYDLQWRELYNIASFNVDLRLEICTDMPQEASEFFDV